MAEWYASLFLAFVKSRMGWTAFQGSSPLCGNPGGFCLMALSSPHVAFTVTTKGKRALEYLTHAFKDWI